MDLQLQVVVARRRESESFLAWEQEYIGARKSRRLSETRETAETRKSSETRKLSETRKSSEARKPGEIRLVSRRRSGL